MDQSLFDTSEICYQQGIRQAVFSPGSRNAALSISFYRNTKINTRVIVDERSAAYIALGTAQQTKRPVVICCTSGTALLNYGPAIAEAYFQKVPLVILSADRPPEWVDQWDGQTVHQSGVFNQHVAGSYELPVDRTHPDAKRMYHRVLAQAITKAEEKQLPVHVNIPIREPFYPGPFENWSFSKIESIRSYKENLCTALDGDLLSEWDQAKRKVIVLGQDLPTENTLELLDDLIKDQNVPVINEITGNGHSVDEAIKRQDLFLMNEEIRNGLSPDLVLTLGKSTLSKNLKQLIRDSDAAHWHASDQSGFPGDTYSKLTKNIRSKPCELLEMLRAANPQSEEWLLDWQKADRHAEVLLDELQTLKYSEFAAFQRVYNTLPDDILVHLANSMPVRYANFLGLSKPNQRVFCNRGTSGIDGTNATAVGCALNTEKQVVLLTGDLSFLYDRNAFLHEYDLSNMRVIVFNNFGGGIFDLIPGPSKLEASEKETHFTTPHSKDMKHSALDAGMLYFKANDEVTLELSLNDFFERSDRPKLLEIQTAPNVNKEVYLKIKRHI